MRLCLSDTSCHVSSCERDDWSTLGTPIWWLHSISFAFVSSLGAARLVRHNRCSGNRCSAGSNATDPLESQCSRSSLQTTLMAAVKDPQQAAALLSEYGAARLTLDVTWFGVLDVSML